MAASPLSQNSLQALTLYSYNNNNCNEQQMFEDHQQQHQQQQYTSQPETPLKIRLHLDIFKKQTITPLYQPSIENDEVPDIEEQLSADVQSKVTNNQALIGVHTMEQQNQSLQSQPRSRVRTPIYQQIQKEMHDPMINRLRIVIQVARFAIRVMRAVESHKILEIQKVPTINQKQYNLINDKAAPEVYSSWAFNSQFQIFSGSQQAASSNNCIVATIGQQRKKDIILDKKKAKTNFCQAASRVINKFLIYLDSLMPIIDQQSSNLAYWQWLIAILTTFGVVYYPFRFSLNQKINRDYSFLNIIFVTFFLIDILIQANSSYFEKGNPVINRASIIRRYVKTKLAYDIVTVILPMICSFHELYQDYSNQSVYGIMMLFFIGRIFNLSSYLSEKRKSLSFTHITNIMISIIFQTTLLLYIIHFLSCTLFFISMEEFKDTGTGWIKRNDLIDKPNTVQYLYSLQELVNLLFHSNTTKIYNQGQYDGDNDESVAWKIFTIVTKILSLGLMAFVITSLHFIFKVYYKIENQHNQQLNQLNMYLNQHEVKSYLRKRALKYLEYQYELNELVSTGVNNLWPKNNIYRSVNNGQLVNSGVQNATHFKNFEHNLNCLPSYIKDEIIQDANIKVLQKVEFLSTNFSEGFLHSLALVMQESIYNQGEVIKLQNTLEEPSLSIVAEGEVELYIEIGAKVNECAQKKHLELVRSPGGSFGKLEFFTQNYEVKHSVQATCFSRILKVSLTDFVNTIKKFPSDREQFCYLKDQVVLYRNINKISVSCYFCSDIADHSTLECPYLFYGRIMNNIMAKGIQHVDAQIKMFKRSKRRKKFKTLQNNQGIQDKALLYLQQLKIERNPNNSSEEDDDVDDILSYYGPAQKCFFVNEEQVENAYTNNNKVGKKQFDSNQELVIDGEDGALVIQSKKQLEDLQERIDKGMQNNLNLLNPFGSLVSLAENMSDPIGDNPSLNNFCSPIKSIPSSPNKTNRRQSSLLENNKGSPKNANKRKSSLFEDDKDLPKNDNRRKSSLFDDNKQLDKYISNNVNDQKIVQQLELKREMSTPNRQILDYFNYQNEENDQKVVKSEGQIRELEMMQSNSPFNKSKKSQYSGQLNEQLPIDQTKNNWQLTAGMNNNEQIKSMLATLVQQQQQFLQLLQQQSMQQLQPNNGCQCPDDSAKVKRVSSLNNNLQTYTPAQDNTCKVCQSGSFQVFEKEINEKQCNCKRPFMFDLDFVDENNNMELNILINFTKYYPNNNYHNVIEQYNKSIIEKTNFIVRQRKITKLQKKQTRIKNQSQYSNKSLRKNTPATQINNLEQ